MSEFDECGECPRVYLEQQLKRAEAESRIVDLSHTSLQTALGKIEALVNDITKGPLLDEWGNRDEGGLNSHPRLTYISEKVYEIQKIIKKVAA
jgi:hypothetical protein